ncbi:MAG: AarF/UbiB family protein [Tepidisphaeraceae bacterium]|jgi:ubiquinone biosynthesis protein
MPAFHPIARRIRQVQRYVQVLEVLGRNGFADLAERIGVDALIDRGREILGAARREDRVALPMAQRVRGVLESLGPTYIKLGQMLSTRPDLIPPEWAEEFKKLQDNVAAVPFEQIEKVLEAEFTGRVTALFETIQKEPLAAASMAQVHRASMHDGARVVLKVLRPGTRQVAETDMEILHALAATAEAHFANLGYSPTEVVTEFAKVMEKEVDLTHEGRATDRLRRLFEDDPDIVFAKVYWEATTRNVLALEEIRGIVLSRLKEGDISEEDRHRLVENGARAVFRQCLEFGFFHADPHPGNLIALPGGRIAFIDCGMTGQLDPQTTQQLADLVRGVVAGDLNRVMSVIALLADVEPEKLEGRGVRSDVNAILTQFQNTPLEELNFGALLRDFFAALRAHQVRCPADLIMLIKAMTMIESVARELDPSFKMVDFARPHLEKLIRDRYSVSAIRTRLQRGLMQYIELAESLPGEVRPLLSQLRRNKLALNLEHRGLDRLTREIEHASRNISVALVVAALLVGSSILVLAGRNPGAGALATIGIIGFIVAAVAVVWIVFSNWWWKGD